MHIGDQCMTIGVAFASKSVFVKLEMNNNVLWEAAYSNSNVT